MSAQLKNALSELKNSGAINLPSESSVLGAPDRAAWSGKDWQLVKNSANSFDVMIGN